MKILHDSDADLSVLNGKTVAVIGYGAQGRAQALCMRDSGIHVIIGVRPEGFELAEDGALTCNLSNVEVMGRDVSVVSTHEASANPVVRSIINADNKVDVTAETVKYTLKAHKVFIFDKETEERIYF